ncbi:MAG TPA: OmpA family protein [Myxococcaceae bacterium]|nr:OmpA family protein [Myxococcaceae bacterium]
MRKGLIFGLTAFFSTAAFAQQQNSTLTTNLDRFAINPSGNGSLLISDGALVPEGQLTLSLLSSYAQHLSLTRGTDSTTPSMDRLYGHLAASFGLTDWAEGSFQLPLILSESAAGATGPLALASYAPILALRAGVNESGSMPVSLSVELAATFLFGSSTSAISVANSRPMPALRLNVGKNLGDVRVFGELNAIEHVDETFHASATQWGRVGDYLGGGLGLYIPFGAGFSAEAAGTLEFDIDNGGTTSQLHFGARYQTSNEFALVAAGGPAFGDLIGTPNWRFMGGVMYTPMKATKDRSQPTPAVEEQQKPVVVAPPPDKCAAKDADASECPNADFDQDGIANRVDQCPTEGGLARLEGCPFRDKDADGIADADDVCPEESGIAARKGCPVRDRDNDGVVDLADACPNDKGLIELKGCPEKDSDEDGIADHLDNCPQEKGLVRNSGCSAKNRQLVVITKDALEIKDRIYFGSSNAKIMKRSHKLLVQIADVLKTHGYIEKLMIQGHTDTEGNMEKNRKLSQARADAVRSFLINQGLEPGRLEAKGFGPDKPIDTNSTAAGRANNRRVEFIVVHPEPPAPTT